MSLVTFFKKIITSSIKRMVKGVEKEIRVEGKASVALVATVIFIMKEMRMVKGLRLFELMLHGLFAERKMNMPGEIAELFAPATTLSVPAPKTKVVATKKVVAVAKPTAPRPVEPVSTTEPAREITEKKSPLEQFIGFLAVFVADKRRLNVAKTCEAAANLLNEGLKMTVDQANTLFAAIRKADSLGLHILDRRTDLAFLDGVPAEVLSDHMFGLEGALNSLIGKVRMATEKDRWIIPFLLFNTKVLLTLDKKGGLGEVELSRTEALLIAMQGNTEIKFPDKAYEDLRSIVGPMDRRWKGNDMMAKKLANIHVN